MARRRSFRFLKFALAVITIAAAMILTRSWWLSGLARALIRSDPPAKADMAVVLAGDTWGKRIEKGGDLVREGYVPAVLVSGPHGAYGVRECDLAIAYAVRHGYPESWFIPLPNESRSTQEEAWAVMGELRRRKVHRILLVTSEYHTGRAYRTYQSTARKIGTPLEIRVIAASDPEFHSDSWWQSRQGQKVTFLEWTKTVAEAFGL